MDSQNKRIYALSIEDIPEDTRASLRFKHEEKVMLRGAASKKGKFPLVFIDAGIRITTRFYIDNVLRPVVKESGQQMYSEQEWTF